MALASARRMIASASAPMDYARLFDGSSSSESGGPTAGLPVKLDASGDDVLKGLNPLHHLPVVGMIYRAATGETIPTPMRVLGAGILGGGLGMIGAAFMSLLEELIRMGPDTSRPSTPAGMAQTGSEAGMQPVTPGTLTGGAYVTLATTTPDFLQNSTPNTAMVQNGTSAYQQASMEWQRSQWVEKGMG